MANEDLPPLEIPVSVQYPYDIALVIDGIVFQIMNVTGQAAAQFLSQPTFVRLTTDNFAKVGWKYVDGVFVPPEDMLDTGL